MGTLGQYLREAREAMGIDLRDAAQETRISFNYLKALEEKTSQTSRRGFVRGFLKNYGRF
jgi:cytoskeletal protein RodZ